MDLALQPQLITDPTILRQIFLLRVAAWATEGVVFPGSLDEGWKDEYDDVATHWAIFNENNTLLAAARLTVHSKFSDVYDSEYYPEPSTKPIAPIAVFGRAVVSPEARGLGLSHSLDMIRLQKARELHCCSIVGVTSNPLRVPSLSKLGFIDAGQAQVLRGNKTRTGHLMVLIL